MKQRNKYRNAFINNVLVSEDIKNKYIDILDYIFNHLTLCQSSDKLKRLKDFFICIENINENNLKVFVDGYVKYFIYDWEKYHECFYMHMTDVQKVDMFNFIHTQKDSTEEFLHVLINVFAKLK